MNEFQKIVLYLAAALIVGMLLFPPFVLIPRGGMEVNMGYNFIFNAPIYERITAVVNTSMLITQWVGVVLIAAIIFYTKRGTKNT